MKEVKSIGAFVVCQWGPVGLHKYEIKCQQGSALEVYLPERCSRRNGAGLQVVCLETGEYWDLSLTTAPPKRAPRGENLLANPGRMPGWFVEFMGGAAAAQDWLLAMATEAGRRAKANLNPAQPALRVPGNHRPGRGDGNFDYDPGYFGWGD